MAQPPLVNSVKKYLASHYMFAVEEWLSGFVDYLMENNNRNCSEADVQSLAKEQWLLNDLKDICPGCLPVNLKHQKKTTLNGRFILQINASVDIGTPAYQQYLKLQKINMENVEATTNFEEKVSSNRMIKLYLTDGVQEVSAIEYKPMRNLSCDITPGCKVLIKGPVECRRGVMLLTECNLELLGGEVQELADTNSLVDLLANKLGLSAFQSRENDNSNSHVKQTDTTQLTAAIQNISRPPPQTTTDHFNQPSTELRDLDTFDDDIDVDQLAAIEAQFANPAKRPLYDGTPKPEKRAKTNPAPMNNIDDYPDLDDFLTEDDDYARELEAKLHAEENRLTAFKNEAPISIHSEPYIYIKQIKELSDTEWFGKVFYIKGQIIKLLSKLFVGKEGWSLKCAIVDGTGSLDVDFTSDVLSNLVGYTPADMNRIKKQMATQPELKETVLEALERAKERLQVLYCIIELTMSDGPKITKLIPFDSTHAQHLIQRKIPDES